MLLELAEVLACPRCGPPRNVVVVVHEQAGRRVREGFLGCPACEARFPIRAGTVRMRAVPERAEAGSDPQPQPEPAGEGAHPPAGGAEASLIAALIGHRGGGGVVLLGPGLEGAASALAGLLPGTEVVTLLTGDRPSETPVEALKGVPGGEGRTAEAAGAGVSRLEVASGERLPVLDGRLLGVAAAGGLGPPPAEAARALCPGGRLVMLGPCGLAGSGWTDLSLERLAGDDRAVVARRV